MATTDDWSTTPGSNGSTLGVNIAEGCDAANINNAIRELMAQAKTKFDEIDTDLGGAASGDALDAIGALTPASNKGSYFTNATTAALYDLTAYGRTLAGLADVAALVALIITASSLISPGYLKLANGFFLMWGTKSVTGGGTTTAVTYNTELGITTGIGTFSVAGAWGGSTGDVNLNGPYAHTPTVTGFSVYNNGTATTVSWIAVGK